MPDIDGDGIEEVLVGGRQYSTTPGKTWVLSGQTGALLQLLSGESGGDEFGSSVADAGDVDNDGVADFIVGAPFNDAVGFNAGRAYVYSGLTFGLLRTLSGEASGDLFGTSVAGAGDVDGDSFDDLLVGAPGAGKVYLISGFDSALLAVHTGSSSFGQAIASGDDIDGDGIGDYFVGEPDGGQVFGYSGATGATVFYSQTGTTAFGYSLDAGLDIDADGVRDLLIGDKDLSNRTGRAYINRLGDPDLDVFTSACDNCPSEFNPDQADGNSNGVGDICEPCLCLCHADPACDGVVNVLDVVQTVNVAFRNAASLTDPLCPNEFTDVDCNGVTNVLDVVRVVNVAFRNADPAAEFCAPCP
jgi:hypothetical protein